MPWITGGAIAGGALLGSSAAKSAGKAQADATRAAVAEQRRQYDIGRADLAPWRDVGSDSIMRIRDLIGLQGGAGGDFTADPGYQFRLNEGNKTLENAARSRGMYMSPSTVKGLMRYGQDYASGEYNNVYNRFAGVAGLGQNAANTTAGLGAQTAGTIGDLITSGANARGAAGIAGANAWGNAIGQGLNMYNQTQMMKHLFPSMSSGAFGTGAGA